MENKNMILIITIILAFTIVSIGFIVLAYLLEKWWLSLLAILVIKGINENIEL